MRNLLGALKERARPATRRPLEMVLILVLLVAGVGGCASTLMIITQPSNATVVVDGREIGQSPILYQGESAWDGAVDVRARLEGYQEAVRRVPRTPNWHHLGESILFPPAIAWGWYLPHSVTLFLEPIPKTTP